MNESGYMLSTETSSRPRRGIAAVMPVFANAESCLQLAHFARRNPHLHYHWSNYQSGAARLRDVSVRAPERTVVYVGAVVAKEFEYDPVKQRLVDASRQDHSLVGRPVENAGGPVGHRIPLPNGAPLCFAHRKPNVIKEELQAIVGAHVVSAV